MNGLQMMLKSFGVDPEELKKMATDTLEKLGAELKDLKDTQRRMETKLDAVLKADSKELDETFQLPEGVTDAGSFDSTR